ncbi:MAG: glycosyl hydrolase [Thermoleophilaceae bacterium]
MRRAVVAVGCTLAAAVPAHAALPRGFVGLYGDDSFFGDSDYREGQMSMQAASGVQTLRQPFEWWRVERRPGHFDWSGYDSYIAAAATAGLHVLPVLMAPPQFRSSRPPRSRSRAMFPPRRNSDFARFARSAVARYGANGSFWSSHRDVPYVPVRSWQVWNEPNIPNFWRSGANAHEYVALLKAAAAAIRDADPGGEVVAAGLPNSNLGVPFLDYVRRMYSAGAKGSFDTLAIHPYSHTAEGLLHLVERARMLMDANGDRRAHLWITEFGWSTGGDASPFRVSRRGQAARISEVLSALAAERGALRLRGFVVFQWKDSTAMPDTGRDPWPLHTGLLGGDGFPKPGYWSFARTVHGLSRAPDDGGSAEPALIARRTLYLSPRGYAAVTMGCRADVVDACAGTLSLRTARPVHCGRRARRAGSLVGAAAFRIAVAPALVPVRLTPGSRELARCVGRMRVRASAATPGAAHAAAAESVELVLRAR